MFLFLILSIGFVLTKYHCPSPACKLLLLGTIVFGFTAKGIARSTTPHVNNTNNAVIPLATSDLIFQTIDEIFWLLTLLTIVQFFIFRRNKPERVQPIKSRLESLESSNFPGTKHNENVVFTI